MSKVVIGIPCMDTVSTSFFSSVLGQRYDSVHQYSYAIEAGSMVYDARGRIAQRAINAGAEWLIMYDSDMVLPPETTQRLLDAAMGDAPSDVVPYGSRTSSVSAEGADTFPKGEDLGGGLRSFVSGLYFMRRLPTKPLILKELDWYEDEVLGAQEFAEVYEDYPRDSVFEIAGCGFGCCVMSVEMVKHMTVAYRMNPFTPMPRLSEDYSFCLRARKLGYKLWCDSRIRPLHAGLKLYGEADWDRQREAEDDKA